MVFLYPLAAFANSNSKSFICFGNVRLSNQTMVFLIPFNIMVYSRIICFPTFHPQALAVGQMENAT